MRSVKYDSEVENGNKQLAAMKNVLLRTTYIIIQLLFIVSLSTKLNTMLKLSARVVALHTYGEIVQSLQ